MPDTFQFSLTDDEKRALKDLVHHTIASHLGGADADPGDAPTQRLTEHLGAFVTLTIDGQLRGCIGHVIGDKPLWDTIHAMALQAAFNDPRFPPLTTEEFNAVTIEISILSPLTLCPDPDLIRVGTHGLLIQHAGRSGLLLPQVPVEWGWDRLTFLQHTCNKAGLPPDAWTKPDANIFWFQAEVF